MVALSRCLGSLALLVGSASAARIQRTARKQSPKELSSRERALHATTKFIAGVPVLNYREGSWQDQGLDKASAKDEWNLIMKPDVSDSEIEEMCRLARNGCKLSGHPSEGGVPFLEMHGSESDVAAVIEQSNGVVKYIEPDHMVSIMPDEVDEDVQPESTWGLGRVGASKRPSEGAGVTIFVFDTGVRVSHQEFGGRAFPAFDVSDGVGQECTDDLKGCAMDIQGHGTHCAGTAAGAAYGVAPAAAVAAVKTLSDRGGGAWSWLYRAVDWLASSSSVRPAVASMSLGGRDRQPGMQDAVDAATNTGVVVVVAAGNSNMDACMYSPAYATSAITVGSTQIKYSRDRRSGFSNHGSCVNIWAPGSNVVSAGVVSDDALAQFSGTSMACPHVSGGAALVLEANPAFNRDQVLEVLLANSRSDSITGLYAYDTNNMLYVGSDAPPPPGKVTLPPAEHPGYCNSSFASGPDRDGECECYGGDYPLLCYEGIKRGCPYQFMGRSVQFYRHDCVDCHCK